MRNRAKRLVREVFRLHKPGVDSLDVTCFRDPTSRALDRVAAAELADRREQRARAMAGRPLPGSHATASGSARTPVVMILSKTRDL